MWSKGKERKRDIITQGALTEGDPGEFSMCYIRISILTTTIRWDQTGNTTKFKRNHIAIISTQLHLIEYKIKIILTQL